MEKGFLLLLKLLSKVIHVKIVFFADKEGCPYLCFKDMRSDGKDVIFKEVKE